MLGGGLRQTGVLAAAGLIAIQKIPALLINDHKAAEIIRGTDCMDKHLNCSDGISTIPALKVTMSHTNFVFFDLTESCPFTYQELEQKLRENSPSILCKAYTETTFRFVTHQWITEEKAHIVVSALKKIFE
jgi:threonine aldolase